MSKKALQILPSTADGPTSVSAENVGHFGSPSTTPEPSDWPYPAPYFVPAPASRPETAEYWPRTETVESFEFSESVSPAAWEDITVGDLELYSAKPIPRIPIAQKPTFVTLQTWEGEVREIRDEEFDAILRDLTDPAKQDEVVTLPIDDVSNDDRALLLPGAVFYWSIGYSTDEYGQRARMSRLRFRRLPGWSSRELKEIDEQARQLAEVFGAGNGAGHSSEAG
jgi:hypothetical protein